MDSVPDERNVITSRIRCYPDAGLLLLRVVCCSSLFYNHGWEKIAHFHATLARGYPDPVGIGATASLAIALVSDAICSLLVLVGFATRFASAYIVCNLMVALVFVHRFQMSGPHSGELVLIYLGVFLALLLTGPGALSVDGYLSDLWRKDT